VQLIRFQSAQLRFSKLLHADLDEDLRLISEATADALNVERASVWLFDDTRRQLISRTVYSASRRRHEPAGTKLEAARYPAYFGALESALIIAADDAHADPRTAELGEYLRCLGIGSLLNVPLRRGGQVVGVLCHEHTGGPRTWEPEEEAFGISIAEHVALSLAAADRRSMEAALRASEERFSKAFRASPHPVVIADLHSGTLIEANDAAYQLFQYEDAHGDGGLRVLEAALWPSAGARRRFIQDLERRGFITNFEVSLRTLGGETRHCFLSAELIELNGHRCMVIVGTDVTEQKRAEEALRHSEARFRTMAEALPQQVWTACQDGDLDYVNQRCLEYFGASPESLTGSNWQQGVHPDDLPECMRRWAAARATGEPYRMEFRLRRASDHSYRWHVAQALPLLDSDRRIVKWIGTNTDVHDAKTTQEALRHREQDLRHAIEERERISQDLHDGILQSLYAVGLGLESCKPLIKQRKHQDACETMERAISQLNHVMADVRNFIAGLESEVLHGSDFETALRTAVTTTIQAHPIDCRIHIEQGALPYIPMDRGLQLLNILREAVSNIVRHARARHVSVSLRRLRRAVRLRIHDNGIGFDSKAVAGTGHGLVNMAARARRMGTEFELHSAPGEGTTIIVDLPKEEGYAHAENQTDPPAARR
jgi:PAS domain S-box-containing protein